MHYDIEIRGRVQGVGFRYWTKDEAGKLGITGFVRNRPDGSVSIAAEAEEYVLEQFVAWCRKGPGRAVVKEVSISKSEIKGYAGFEVK